MRTTIRDYVDGKADLAFGSYGVPKPVEPGRPQRLNEDWSDPKNTELERTPPVAAKKKVKEE